MLGIDAGHSLVISYYSMLCIFKFCSDLARKGELVALVKLDSCFLCVCLCLCLNML